MKGGKAPGPDGLPINIYKMYNITLISLDMFVDSINSGKLPPSLHTALIILTMKSRKVLLTDFINSDTKLIAKILAHSLQRYLSFLSDPDQNGFVKGHQAWHCVRSTLNIVYAKTEHPDTAVLSLVAEKKRLIALSRYLHKVLAHFGFGNYFSNWIKVLY